ncbi:MAG: amidase [Haloarculaceae archaeon]
MTDADTAVDADSVRDLADRLGLALDDLDAAVDSVADGVELAATLAPSLPESEPATDVREGDDEYDAFRQRFDLAAADGPLSDLSVATKENVFVAGVPATCGSRAFAFTPEYSATVIRRLQDAGASVVGTTNMDEFALFTTGETCQHGEISNPAAPDRVPGGSSGGSGAAVAAGLVDAALGSDTGGSIRIPASFCGVVGLKPTHRAVPRFGFVDLAPSLDHVGPLARDVETAARVFDAIAGPSPEDPSTLGAGAAGDVAAAIDDDVSSLRIGLVEDALGASTDAVAETVRETAADLPVAVESVSLPTVESLVALSVITGGEFAALVEHNGQVYGTGTGYSEPYRAALAAMDPNELGSTARNNLLTSAGVTAATDDAAYVAAQGYRRSFTRQAMALLSEYDALVTPTTPTTALPFGAVETQEDLIQTLANTGPFDLTGHPALSVPCGEVSGRPVGFQVVTDYHDEATAVAIGRAVEDL